MRSTKRLLNHIVILLQSFLLFPLPSKPLYTSIPTITCMNLSEIKSILQSHKQELKEKYKVAEIGIFGSYVKGEQKDGSDIDIIVEFGKGGKTFDNYMNLKFFCEEILGSKIDLVLKRTIREEIRHNVLSEVTYV